MNSNYTLIKFGENSMNQKNNLFEKFRAVYNEQEAIKLLNKLRSIERTDILIENLFQLEPRQCYLYLKLFSKEEIIMLINKAHIIFGDIKRRDIKEELMSIFMSEDNLQVHKILSQNFNSCTYDTKIKIILYFSRSRSKISDNFLKKVSKSEVLDRSLVELANKEIKKRYKADKITSESDMSNKLNVALKAAKEAGININIQNSTIGFLNTAELEDVESIFINVSTLSNLGHKEIEKSLKNLTEAVLKIQEISSEMRIELLEYIGELSHQATLSPHQRSSKSVIKAILVALATGLQAAGGLAEVWTTWGQNISKFFGL